MDMKGRTRNRDQKRLLEPEEDADARARSGCSCQKWMLVPEVDARARIGCHARTRVEKSTRRRRLPKNGLVQTPIFSRRDPFRDKAIET